MAFQMDSHKGGIKEIKPEHYIYKEIGKPFTGHDWWSVKVPMAPAAKISGWIYLGAYPKKKDALACVEKYLEDCLPKKDVTPSRTCM